MRRHLDILSAGIQPRPALDAPNVRVGKRAGKGRALRPDRRCGLPPERGNPEPGARRHPPPPPPPPPFPGAPHTPAPWLPPPRPDPRTRPETLTERPPDGDPLPNTSRPRRVPCGQGRRLCRRRRTSPSSPLISRRFLQLLTHAAEEPRTRSKPMESTEIRHPAGDVFRGRAAGAPPTSCSRRCRTVSPPSAWAS